MQSKTIRIAENFSKKVNDNHISAYASSTAFFTFLSLFPMLMLILAILPYTPLEQAFLLRLIATVFPESMVEIISSIVEDSYSASGALLPITLIFMIWSAAKGMLALLRGLNVIFGVEERRNYFLLRFRASIYTVAMLAMILVLLIGVVFAKRIRDLFITTFPQIKPLFDLLVSVRSVFVIGILTLIFSAIYTYLPNVKNRFHWEVPGALFSAVCWYFTSWVFSVYVNRVSGANMFGSLTTVIIAMLWMYAIFYITLLGACLNEFLLRSFRVFSERRRQRRRESRE